MSAVEVAFQGPDLFCPECGRQLFGVRGDGSFDLAERAAIKSKLRVDALSGSADALVLEARCLRWRCRFKTWIHSG